jgi:DNA-binding MarR family transcriptional regulator
VHRQRDINDLRAYRVYLTERGKEIREVVLEKSIYFVSTLLSSFTPEEKEVSRQLTQKASLKFNEKGLEPYLDMPNDMT